MSTIFNDFKIPAYLVYVAHNIDTSQSKVIDIVYNVIDTVRTPLFVSIIEEGTQARNSTPGTTTEMQTVAYTQVFITFENPIIGQVFAKNTIIAITEYLKEQLGYACRAYEMPLAI